MSNASPVRALLLYAAIGTPIAVLVFLLSSKFLVAWDGHAVGMQPLQSADPDFYRVLIVEDDGGERLFDWPADEVEGLEIPLTQILAPPPRIPDTAPHTSKSRFTMHYLMEQPDGRHRAVPTTSPRGLALAALVWIMGLFLRNMIVSGSPLEWRARPTVLPSALPTAGQVAENRAARSKKGPPPPRRGKRRR